MEPPLIGRVPSGPARPHPLLFVHGAWHGAWCWEERLLPFFADAGYEAYALDLRGHGDDPQPVRRGMRIADYAADLDAAVRSLDRAPVLVGHSMGGFVVQRYLEGRRLPGAVLLATVPVSGAWGASMRIARRHPVAFLAANATLRLGPIVKTPRLVRSLLLEESTGDDEVARIWRRLGDEAYRAFLDMLVRRPRPTRVLTPILVVAAGRDRLFSVAEQRATARAYGTEAVVVEGAAHDLMLDPMWEEAARAMLTWLEG
jgi:pimeloyl-ACP methyl ester carboxylesterase